MIVDIRKYTRNIEFFKLNPPFRSKGEGMPKNNNDSLSDRKSIILFVSIFNKNEKNEENVLRRFQENIK